MAEAVFHGNAALHDPKPDTKGWWSSASTDIPAAWKVLTAKNKQVAAANACAELPLNDPLNRFLTGGVVKTLGNQFQYRMPDGSNNNILYPDLGKAKTPYAKTVPGARSMHGAKPDPGDLFDLLLCRQNESEQKESDLGLSSLLLYHATLIIHDIFRTNAHDKNISDTSSYLDLSPLYGIDGDAQRKVRTGSMGMLHPDSFAEERLQSQPPGVSVLLIMYCRFHNYVAEQLFAINENGKFSRPANPPNRWHKPALDAYLMATEERLKEYSPLADYAAWEFARDTKLDEDLFQTARLITNGLYINISIHDYLRVLMRMHAKSTSWTLDPRIEIPEAMSKDKTGVHRGTGNQVSAEFNVLYRFHSPVSQRDTRWTNEVFKGILKPYVNRTFLGEEFTEERRQDLDIPVDLMRTAIDDMYKMAQQRKPGPSVRNPPMVGISMKRQADGRFRDEDLVSEIVRTMEDPMCQFGARNIPKAFRSIEIMGILQARKWELATLNEFREFFGMSRHTKFEDINSDPEIQNALRDLYEDPDMVELYPGLVCEGEGQCLDPGTSCPGGQGTALWRGVFSDAVTLVRSDRFYTVDWNVDSLTAWGMAEVTSDPDILKGSVFHRLFQRAFPGYFKFNSIHLWEPFYTPAMNYVLAEQQVITGTKRKYAEDLEPISHLGMTATTCQLKPEQSREEFRKTLDNLKQAGVFKEYDVKDCIKSRQLYDDGKLTHAECTARLRFKQLKNVVKMADPTKKTNFANLIHVEDYDEIKQILEEPLKYKNPSVLDLESIPMGPLRDVFAGTAPYLGKAAIIFDTLMTEKEEDLILRYTVAMAQSIQAREQRKFQSRKIKVPSNVADVQVWQIDIVRDYVVPVMTNLAADLLGFGDKLKTKDHLDRPYSDNDIYEHFNNCQDYLTYDSDETTLWRRRLAFRKSIVVLKDLTEAGVTAAQSTFWERTFGTDRKIEDCQEETVRDLKKLGIKLARTMREKFGMEEAAAVMLSAVMQVLHKSVVTFVEVLDCLLHHEDKGSEGDRAARWRQLRQLATSDKTNKVSANQQIRRYVLEAQRLRGKIPLLREVPGDVHDAKYPAKTFLLLHMDVAQQDSSIFYSPDQMSIDASSRPLSSYLLYSQSNPHNRSKQIALVALCGLIKHVATMKRLRRSHDAQGRLKIVRTPNGQEKYMTPKWDQLVPFPTTWKLRFDTYDDSFNEANVRLQTVYTGGDNSEVGHSIDTIYQDASLSAGTRVTRRVALAPPPPGTGEQEETRAFMVSGQLV